MKRRNKGVGKIYPAPELHNMIFALKDTSKDPTLDFILKNSDITERLEATFKSSLISDSKKLYFDGVIKEIEKDEAGNIITKKIYGHVLLSLICLKLWKINCYHKYLRNVKNEEGVWEQVAAFNFEDPEPFGHGEKLVFLISKFLRLTNGEAYAIRYHMGFQKKTVGEMLVKHLRSTHLLWLSMLQVVCDEFKDNTLSKLWKEHRDYFGNLEGDIFPLLIKILYAKTDLSI